MLSNATNKISLKLKIWRQQSAQVPGQMVDYQLDQLSTDMSFLEMLDILNEKLILQGEDPVAFDHDCREGICGCCSLMINGMAHGPQEKTTTCQLHLRNFSNGETVVVEPFRARAFPVIKDLVVDRSALDKMIQAGGYISVSAGSAPESNSILVPKENAELAMDAAACIGCGACVASCPNASAMLFLGAKISHLALLPQGQVEAATRVLKMVNQMDLLGLGNCSNHTECEAQCPKGISISNIARLNREYLSARIFSH